MSIVQKVISLYSCEAELRAVVSPAHEFALGTQADHRIFTDSLHAPTCDEERSWKGETLGRKVVMDSEQERLQDGRSINR